MCRKRAPVCQVCLADLLALQIKAYCVKKRACPEHMAAEAVTIPGREGTYRFCHQCGRFEPLACFDGVKRSCRTRLVTRRLRISSKGAPSPRTATSDACAAAAAGAGAAAGSAPANSPAASLNAGASAAPAHSCSVLSVDAAPMQLRDQQVWSHSAAAGVPGIALSSPQQQQQHEGNAGAGFEDFLHGLMEDELQQIMQQEQQGAAQPPASAHLGALSAPVAMQSAVLNPVLLGGCAAGLYRSASTGTAVLCPAAVAPGLQAGGTDIASAGTSAAMLTMENTALRRQQLLLQAKQLLEEERQLRELALTTSDEATTCLIDALCPRGFIAAGGVDGSAVPAPSRPVLSGDALMTGASAAIGFAAMQTGSITDGLAPMPVAQPLALPATAGGRLLAPGSLQLASQLLLPQGAAAAPLTQDCEGPSDVNELRRELQQATTQLQELKTVVSSAVNIMSGGAPYFGPALP